MWMLRRFVHANLLLVGLDYSMRRDRMTRAWQGRADHVWYSTVFLLKRICGLSLSQWSGRNNSWVKEE